MKYFFQKLSVGLLLGSMVFQAWAFPFSKIVMFGDSLSDNGNLYHYMKQHMPQSPPYFQGRFSNGPVWVERLAEKYAPTQAASFLLDYAFGGAGIAATEEEEEDVIFTLKHEVDSYLLAHQDRADPHHLFMIWIGSNNYLNLPLDRDETVAMVVKGIVNSAQRLVEKGAKQVVIFNLPDLGQSPFARATNTTDALTQYTIQHNQLLKQRIMEQMHQDSTVKWVYVDVNAWLNEAIASPAQFGFTQTTDACLPFVPASSILNMTAQTTTLTDKPPSSCEGYLFFDAVHPSAQAHQLIAERLFELL